MLPILFAPENTPFMVALAVLALLALAQVVGLAHLGHADLDHPDLHAETDVGAGLASLLGIGRLPLLAWLSVLLAVFGLGGLTLQQLADGMTGHMLPALPASGLTLLGALPVTGLLSRPLAHIWPKDETSAIDIEALLARRGRIEIGTASRNNPARAMVKDETGQMHLVMVEPHEDGTMFHQGDEVLLVRREGDRFYAIACDPPFLTAGD
ncbi:MAG: YqiJ family protein [Sphingobium sp.]|nr:YqiJ family protein [Sphingobium sp.]